MLLAGVQPPRAHRQGVAGALQLVVLRPRVVLARHLLAQARDRVAAEGSAVGAVEGHEDHEAEDRDRDEPEAGREEEGLHAARVDGGAQPVRAYDAVASVKP